MMKRRYSPRAVLSQIVVTMHGPLGKNSIYAPRNRARNLSKKQFFPFTQRPCFRDVPLLARNEDNNFINFTKNTSARVCKTNLILSFVTSFDLLLTLLSTSLSISNFDRASEILHPAKSQT